MSYLVLARKWRPQHFNEVIGQQPVVRTLQNGLKRNRVPHAMLFSGVRGVGKTTLARIMAKALNCRSEKEDRPCNQCDSCLEITKGSSVDLHEIDGASNRGIQEIRELKENIRFFPTRCRYKIIIIDEVHMLTTEAFNALLKTLEEPPKHVFFMFATTELHKIPITILSRCQRYELKRIPFAELHAFFKKVAEKEGVAVSAKALSVITREADGSVRDGLSLLDQMFSFGGDQVRDEDVTEVLGLVDHTVFEKLAASLLSGDLAQGLELLDRTYRAGIDIKRFASDLLSFFRTVLICKTSPHPGELLDISDMELQAAEKIAAGQSAETLYQYFHLLLQGIEKMHYSPRPRMILEMALIKAAQSGQVVPASVLLERFDDCFRQSLSLPIQQVAQTEPVVVETNQPGDIKEKDGLDSREPSAVKEKVSEKQILFPKPAKIEKDENRASSPKAEKEKSASGDEEKTEITQPEPSGAKSLAPATHQKDVRKNWNDFAAYVKERKPWMSHVLQLCDRVEEHDNALIMIFSQPTDSKILEQSENMKLLTRYVQDFFQKELKPRLRVRGGEDASGNSDDSVREERRALANDPLVRMATEVFGGRVASVRTGPKFR
ncbi:MAG: DNA polymerase III subunit gamma/tau [Thermodesulfobacteriota bacterium]|nr:DNA polymerase III subunit gamma/tau [Thermodesulfobacteriota bacterium]